jgi:hypothetical protein
MFKGKESKILAKPKSIIPVAVDVNIVNSKIQEGRDALMEFNLHKAQQIYINIIHLYNQLPKEEKSKVYDNIKDFYEERKTAEAVRIE